MGETTNTVGDGWHKQTHDDNEVMAGRSYREEIVYIQDGMVLDNYADTELWYRMANGFKYEPVYILTQAEYTALTQQNETLAHNNAVLNGTIVELRETLAFAAQYTGLEGRACPLCKYENGKFIEMCQMHKDMESLRQQVETLQAAQVETSTNSYSLGRADEWSEHQGESQAEWEDVPIGQYYDKGGETLYLDWDDECFVISMDSFDSRYGTSWMLPDNWRLQRRRGEGEENNGG